MVREAFSPEALAQAAWEQGDYAAVTDVVFTAYGGEIYSFLLAQFRGQACVADDVFSAFSEDFWSALRGFQWRCSIRAWSYKLARSASSRHRRCPHNRRERRIPLSDAQHLATLAARTRTETQAHLRSEVRDRVRQLRETLDRDEQDLLVLRVDRGLSWRDVAHAMLDEDDPVDEERCARLEAALRQRFGEIKKRLKRLAREAGLI
jgi:RNA polymerase sigma-70 factor (ECF subfamily)